MSKRDDLDRSGEIRVERIADPRPHVVARKGGGKSGGGGGGITTPHQPNVMPNTLRSRATARVLEVLSEGPVYGLDQGNSPTIWSAVYLDDTPIADQAGNFQFAIREGNFRYGFPSQDPIPGYSMTEAAFSVGVECHYADPVVRAVNLPISAVRYVVRVPALYTQESDGDVVEASVAYAFDISVDSGTWTNVVTEQIRGKTMSPYERAVHVTLPAATTSLQIRVERISPLEPSNTANTLLFSTYTEIQYVTLAYDDSCVASMVIDSEEFQNVPQRAYLLYGLMIDIPVNYNGFTHGYSGDWNGTFYTQWTNNPAWVLYALLTNERWGLGRYIDASAVDKWSFYSAAVYNDGWLSAFNEIRNTCNCVINTRSDAYSLLQAVASNMLAQLYYSNGTIYLVQDRQLYSPTRIFGPADVVEGLFDYTSADVRSRWTAVAVTWNDPNDRYQPAVELVQDPHLVAQQGYKETQANLFGCTSRGQAIRHGRWMIYTSQFETEIVTFRTGLENADLRPGDYIAVSDPSRVGSRLAGRLMDDGGADTITLDKVDDEVYAGPAGWSIYVTTGTAANPEQPAVVHQCGVVQVLPNNQLRITGKTGLMTAGSMWMLHAGRVEPTPWRVAAVADRGAGQYEITATEFHVEKFSYIEQNVLVPQPPFSLIPTGPLGPPSNLAYREYIYLDAAGNPQFGIVASWTPSSDARVQRYQLELAGPSGDYRRYAQVAGVAQEVPSMRQGEWLMTVLAFDNIGRRSLPISLRFIPIGLSERPLPPSALYITPNGRTSTLIWVPTGEIDVVSYWIKWTPEQVGATWPRATTSIAQVDRNTTQIVTPTRSGTFMIKTIDALGQESATWVAAVLVEQITDNVHVLDIVEQPDWGGDRGVNWHFSLSQLLLPPPTAPEPVPPGLFPGDRAVALNQTPTRVAAYGFQDEFNLGLVSSVSMVAIVEGYALFLGTVMAKWTPLASADPLASGRTGAMAAWQPLAMAVPLALGSSDSPNWDAHVEVRVSQDGSTFADWTPLKSALITGRRFQWRMIGSIYDLATTARITRAEVWMEIPLRNVQGSDVALDTTGHKTITYVTPFMAPPTVQLTARQSLAPGGNIVITASTADHFTVEHRKADGTPSTGLPNASIDYFVQGYGGGIPLALAA